VTAVRLCARRSTDSTACTWLGCSKSVVGLVVPAGYSFNLDGTNIYLTMAAIFVAQALNIELTIMQQLTLPAGLPLDHSQQPQDQDQQQDPAKTYIHC